MGKSGRNGIVRYADVANKRQCNLGGDKETSRLSLKSAWFLHTHRDVRGVGIKTGNVAKVGPHDNCPKPIVKVGVPYLLGNESKKCSTGRNDHGKYRF